MDAEDAVLEQFRHGAVRRGGEEYFLASLGPAIVSACEEHDLAVIGIEGFLFEDGFTCPQMELIRDFGVMAPSSSWEEHRRTCNSLAVAFVKAVDWWRGLFLNFVITSHDEWLPYTANPAPNP